MDPRSEVVIRQHEYLSGRVLLINAPTDDLLSNLEKDITPCFWTWNYNELQYFQSQQANVHFGIDLPAEATKPSSHPLIRASALVLHSLNASAHDARRSASV